MSEVWRFGVAVGRAYELLRSDVQSHVRMVQENLGFRYCRFHGLLHDEMGVVVRQKQTGQLHYQWRQVDDVIDFLLSVGLKPFLELGPMPLALASGSETFFAWKMNVTPPKEPREWADLIYRFVIHCVERYGRDEVAQWYFEVWNEPNLKAFWTGTFEEYMSLYAAAARSIKSIDSRFRIGGPAGAEAGWVTEFVDYCQAHRIPYDFVSAHLYPQNEHAVFRYGESTHAPGRYFVNTLMQVREQVPNEKEVHWTEWNTLSSESPETIDWMQNPTIDSLYSAACLVDIVTSSSQYADSLFWWVISDVFEEGGIPHAPFSGTYGLLTVHGLAKASYRAFELLRLMGPGWRTTEPNLIEANADGIRQMLAWNHQPLGVAGNPTKYTFQAERGHGVTRIHLKAGRGSAYETWLAMGSPQNLSKAQVSVLESASYPDVLAFVADGGDFAVELQPGEVVFIEIGHPPEKAVPKANLQEDADAWNVGMGAVKR